MWEYRIKKNPIIDKEGWEIIKLHNMLTEAGIEHHFIDRKAECREVYEELGFEPGYQICVYEGDRRIISVIEGSGTYGFEANRLEIMGLLTDEELKHGSVKGFLTAEDVYKRIERYFKNEK
jgi:hypothetical protein